MFELLALVFLLILSGYVLAQPQLPVLLGIYPHGSDSNPSFAQMAGELEAIDAWLETQGASNGVSIGATFISIENPNPDFNIPYQLEEFWIRGYVPFINIMTSKTMAQIANGSADGQINAWVDALKTWIDEGGGRKVFIAPFPEMNGEWISYGQDPSNFILSFKHLQTIFLARGIPETAVSWVFAPNGWSEPDHMFELYYPGDALVDVVGFSAYNFGYCPAQWQQWETFETAMEPYLHRMSAMAPGKPIFLTQTASVNRGPDGFDESLRSEWIEDVFHKLSNYPGFRAIIYFNKRAPQSSLVNCLPKVDFRIFSIESNSGNPGLAAAMQFPNMGAWSVADVEWDLYAFPAQRPEGSFADVWPAHPFSDRPGPFYFDSVEALKAAQITGGCGTDPISQLPRYCPGASVRRSEMAVFLEKAIRGAGFQPPAASGNVFLDVGSQFWAAAWIEQFARDGITQGCSASPPSYCPNGPVTRAQMAVFLLRSDHWPDSYSPPPASGAMFLDVPAGYWASRWIEELARAGLTGGCSTIPPLYCPEDVVTRGQMAVFIARTFGL